MDEYRYLGDLSATPPWHTRLMTCHTCRVQWGGCWDNFECPICGEGELPCCGEGELPWIGDFKDQEGE